MSQQLNKAAQEYTRQLRGLFALAPGEVQDATRAGGAAVPADILAERAEDLAGASLRLGELTSEYLQSEQFAEREGAEVKLLAQASADAEVALALFGAALDESEGKAEAVTRSGRSGPTQKDLDPLLRVLEAPIEEGLDPFLGDSATRSAAIEAKTIQDLEAEVRRSLRAISRSAGRTSSLGLDTLLKIDPALLKQGAAVVSKELGELIDKISAGLTKIVKQLLRLGLESLLRAYNWVLSLIGKDAEDSARKKIYEWIEELRGSHTKEDDAEEMATKLVSRLYTTESVQEEVQLWLEKCDLDAQALQALSQQVRDLGASYETKVQQLVTFFKATDAAKGILLVVVTKIPVLAPAFPVLAGVTLALVGYTLFTGYDHVDSGTVNLFNRFQVTFPDRVMGVRETVQKAVGA
jgi:hypothetical protein